MLLFWQAELHCLEAEGGTGQEGAQKPTNNKWS